MADLADQVLKALKPTSVLHQVNFHLDPAPTDTPYRVRAETSRLERVLFNLIENALWYSPANGTITVTIAPHDTFVRTTVQDEGPGVPHDLRNDLFEKFVRGNGHGGKLGLGLYFCRISVERWGGQIGYGPRPEGGSIFWFDLPWVPPSDAAHPSGATSAAPPL